MIQKASLCNRKEGRSTTTLYNETYMVIKAFFNQHLREIWNTAEKNNPLRAPFFSYEWHATWYQVLGGNWEPYPLIINNEIIAPFARSGNAVIFSGGEELSDYQDIIGSNRAKIEAWKEVITFLAVEGVKSLSLRNIPHHSPTLVFFSSQQKTAVTKEDTTPYIVLPKTWEAFVESLEYKSRHELRRKIRKFEREHTNIELSESNTIHEDIDILFRLMHKDKKKHAFLTPPIEEFFRRISGVFSKHVSLLLLTIDGRPAAATLSFVIDNAYLLYNSGFDHECCKNSGFYLKAISIKRAIENGYTVYNFLQGNERYKYELGGKDFSVYCVTMAPCEKPLSIDNLASVQSRN